MQDNFQRTIQESTTVPSISSPKIRSLGNFMLIQKDSQMHNSESCKLALRTLNKHYVPIKMGIIWPPELFLLFCHFPQESSSPRINPRFLYHQY